MNNYKRLVLALCTLLFLQSCGISFWYNRLDWIVSWQVDDFVELTDEQEDALEAYISTTVEWHRDTQLARYIEFIDKAIHDLETAPDSIDYLSYRSQFLGFFQAITTEIQQGVLPQIYNLSDLQVEELIANLQESYDDQVKDYHDLSAEERFELAVESYQDRYVDFIGKLQKSQKSLISQWVAERQPTMKLRIEYQNTWREAFADAMSQRTNEVGQERIKELMFSPRTIQSTELTQLEDLNSSIDSRYIQQLINSLTKKQRKRLVGELEDYKEDFVDLLND